MTEKMQGPTEFHAKVNPATGEMECEARYEPSEASRMLAETAVEILRDEGAANFFTFEVTVPGEMRVAITIQRMYGNADTPAAKLSRFAKEIEQLKEQLRATTETK